MDVWAPADILTALGAKSRDTITRWQSETDFPEPVFTHGMTRFYDPAAVRAWHETHVANTSPNRKRRRVVEIKREDPDRSIKSIAKETGYAWQSVKNYLSDAGLL
jgi:predicted DNA-binding transcriptional regulator AlpA